MSDDSVSASVTIAMSTDAVWRLLTAERGIWWPDMTFEAAVGSPLVETWIESGKEKRATGVVTDCVEPRLLAFRWSEEGWERPLDVTIRLDSVGPATAVTITETGFVEARTAPTLPDEHEGGWRYHLTRLKRTCESGSPEVSGGRR